MYQILSRMEETHRVASRLIGTNYGVFEAVSLEMPKFTPAELGFLRSVSWLFVLYHEVGKLNRTTRHWYTRLDEFQGCHAEPQAK